MKKIQDRPPGLKFSSEPPTKAPSFLWGVLKVEIDIFKWDWHFQAGLKISSDIEIFQSLGPQGLCEQQFGALKIANEAIRANRSNVMKIQVFLRIVSRESHLFALRIARPSKACLCQWELRIGTRHKTNKSGARKVIKVWYHWCQNDYLLAESSQKNPHAHKNKIGTLPPPNPKPPPPPKTRNFMDMGFFLQRERIFPGIHKIGAAISGPRIADKRFTDTRAFLKNDFLLAELSKQFLKYVRPCPVAVLLESAGSS